MRIAIVAVFVALVGHACAPTTTPETTSWATTSFFDELEPNELLATVSKGYEADGRCHGRSGKTGSSTVAIRTWRCFVTGTGEVQEMIMGDLRGEMDSLLKQAGCTIHGRGRGHNKPGFYHFDFEYVSGTTAGDVYVDSVSTMNGCSILVSVHEYPA